MYNINFRNCSAVLYYLNACIKIMKSNKSRQKLYKNHRKIKFSYLHIKIVIYIGNGINSYFVLVFKKVFLTIYKT